MSNEPEPNLDEALSPQQSQVVGAQNSNADLVPSSPSSAGPAPASLGSVAAQPGSPGTAFAKPGSAGSSGAKPGSAGSVTSKTGSASGAADKPGSAGSVAAKPGSADSAAARLSGHVHAVSSAKERASSAGSGRASSASSSKRQSGTLTSIQLQLQPASPNSGDGPRGSQTGSARLPPLMHGYAAAVSGTGASRATPLSSGTLGLPQPQLYMEPLQPVSQQSVLLPGPVPAAHPYQPKRKPPSAFMRNNPMRQQLEANSHMHRAGGSAGSRRSYAAAYDSLYALPPDAGAAPADASAALDPAQQQQLQLMQQQQQQFADEVIAAAQAAMLQGQQQGAGAPEGGGFSAVPPWGVSSVSDLEALDSILDQLVVVDARMRKALLKGPLISFETVVPEHIMNAARGYPPQQQQYPGQQQREEDKDRTFMTAVKGMAVEDGGDGVEAPAEVAEAQVAAGAPPPSPAPREEDLAAAAAQQAARQTRSTDESTEPRDSSLFPASIPNPGMHPTFTRAYLTSKLASKPQHLPPPPPATAEHLLRSRPPAFIAAPSYDQLCSQIRDVQRQYTCGTSRPAAGQPAAAAAILGPVAAAVAAQVGAAANQYIAGLDGPTLEEVVAQQELPISLERVRPTFVALKQKAARGPSPRRRPGSPGRSQGVGLPEVQGLVAAEGPA